MICSLLKNRYSPIGVDLGSHSVKLVQFAADRKQLIDAVRWDLPAGKSAAEKGAGGTEAMVEALKQARRNRAFRGWDVVLCLGHDQLFLQNIRVPKS